MRRFLLAAVPLAALTVGALSFSFLGVGSAGASSPSTPTTTYSSAGAPSVDGVLNAPWNPNQGDTAAGPYSGTPFGPIATDQPLLFPTYTPGGVQLDGEPNLAVYPANSATTPYGSGIVGTPGPLADYCGSGNNATEVGGSPTAEPANTDLPFSPYYFPYVVRNANGTLTGFFDWRPKDADEAIVVATSSDDGITWTVVGKALDQNPGYCPSGDTNDDGDGHPYVANLGGTNDLYTLQRAVGDTQGTGELIHPVNPSASNPLSGDPANESVGVDPDTFAANTSNVTLSGTGQALPVSTLGGDATNGNTTTVDGVILPDPSEIYASTATPGVFEDVTEETGGDPAGNAVVVTCTGTSGSTGSSPELTGCTGSITVKPGDELVQVIGVATPTSGDNFTTIPVPAGPNTGSNGVEIPLTKTGKGAGFNNLVTSPITSYFLGLDAAVRVYVDGHTVYCTSTNGSPTQPVTQLSGCTTTTPGGFTIAPGDGVTADSIDPASTIDSTGVPQTNGLLSPDGIIGPIPSADNSDWGEPNGTGTVVLYTEKLINYFDVGWYAGTVATANSSTVSQASLTLPLSTATNLDVALNPTQSEQLPASGSFTVYLAYTTTTANGGTPSSSSGSSVLGSGIVAVTCTGWVDDAKNTNAALENDSTAVGYLYTGDSIDLKGCTTASTDVYGHSDTAGKVSVGNTVAGPGAAIEPYTVLHQIGEGKSKTSDIDNLYGNNEDYEVVRAAYTTDGINFTDLGAISGSDGGAGSTTGSYNDLTDPTQQDSPAGNPSSGGIASNADIDSAHPQGDAPTSLSPGTVDETELRWPGARGTLIVNPDGTLGLFLSGAWGSDGDSDAFNQTFYAESSDGGKTWSAPTVVLSTDYTFSASVAQDNALAAGTDSPLGVSAYYEGRAYDPTVVQNSNGTLTMLFAGYRVPNPVKPAGNPIGTDTSAQYQEGAMVNGSFVTDPAIYRNILTMTLNSSTFPLVGTTSTVTDPAAGSETYGAQATYTDTVTVNSPGAGIPTGTVDFYDNGNAIPTCQNVALSDAATDTAQCQINPSAGTQEITADYSGDSNYAPSDALQLADQVSPAQLTITASSPSIVYGGTTPTVTPIYGTFQNGDSASSLTSAPSCQIDQSSPYQAGGAYTTSCSGAVDANYTFNYVPGTLTVTQAPLTLGVTGSESYGDPSAASFELDGYSSGFVSPDTSGVLSGSPSCSTSANPTGTTTGGAGFYSGTISGCSGVSAANYSISYQDDGFTINTVPLTITAPDGSMTYGGSVPSITPTTGDYSGLVNGDTPASLSTLPACQTNATSSSQAGSGYTTSCSGAFDSNYTIGYVGGSLTVNQAPLTLGVTGSESYGDPSAASFELDGYSSGFVSPDTSGVLSGSPSCSTSANPTGTTTGGAGFYSGTISGCSGVSAANYSISYQDDGFTINTVPLTITASGGSFTYGGTPATIGASYSGLTNGDTSASLTTAPICVAGASSSSPVGSYTSSCSGAVDPNYSPITYDTGTVGVGPATLTITASSPSMTYGGSVPTITAGYQGFVNDDGSSSLTTQPTCSTTAESSSPVGSYGSSCTGASDPNYTISYVAGSVSVVPAPLTITASSASMSYGGSVPAITPGYSGFVLHDNATSLSSQATCGTAATSSSPVSGSPYPTTCAGASDPNYTISYVSGTLTVKPVALKITASGASMTYGGVVPAISATYSGFKNGDSASSLTPGPTCGTTATSSSTVSGSPYVTSCTGASDPNYTISYVNGKLTVKPAPLKITASSGTMTYGGTVPAVTAGYSGFVNGDDAHSLTTQTTCSTTATSSSAVSGSPYPTSCTGASDPNYSISNVNGKITVTKAPLTITASSGSMTYGGTVPAITASYSGFVNHQDASDLTTPPTCSTSATSSSSVNGSPYKTSCTGAGDSNYAVSYVNGTMRVNPAATSVSYTGPLHVGTSSSLVPSASLTSSAAACRSAQKIAFSLDPNPLTGANSTYLLENATTSSSGSATGAALSAKHWLDGGYTLSATFAGTANCVGSTSGVQFSVTTP